MLKRRTARHSLTGFSLTKANKPLPRSVLRMNRRFFQTLGKLAHSSPCSGTVIRHLTNARDVYTLGWTVESGAEVAAALTVLPHPQINEHLGEEPLPSH